MACMSRVPVAVFAGLLGFCVYLAIVLWLGDWVQHLHWAVQAAYFVVAGSLWVLPIRWLMYWSVHRR